MQGATVRSTKTSPPRTVRAEHDGTPHVRHPRWLIDASGRTGLLRRQFNLTEDNGHHISAGWIRIDVRLDPDQWCGNAAWSGLRQPRERWRSTNHLCGPGYWVWLVPLASGAHSIDTVADSSMHPVETYNSFERALAWLDVHQPSLSRQLHQQRDALLDFAFLRHVSYGCRQVFSADRWALTGEAGVFLDPFYSPGSDFIAIGNGYITELIARDFAGQMAARTVRHFQQLFLSFCRNTLSLYRGQYPLFGNGRVMTAKVLWDYTYHWGVLAPLAIGDHATDLALLSDLSAEMAAAEALNLRIQALFRDWHAHGASHPLPDWMDQHELARFVQLNAQLHDRLDATGIRERLREHVELLCALSAALAADAARDAPGLAIASLCTATGQRARPALFGAAA